MRRFLAFCATLALSVVLFSSVLAQGVTFTATPQQATIGEQILLAASGLNPNETYELEVFFVPNGRSVFKTNYVSDSTGTGRLTLFGEDSDPFGVYRVTIGKGGSVVAETTFELVAQKQPTATPIQPTNAPAQSTVAPAQPTAQSTVAPAQPTALPPVGNSGVTLRVVPESAPQRSTFSFFITGLQGGQTVFVIITNDATGTEEYSSSRRASDAGRIELEIFTTAQNAVGTYSVRVEDVNATVLARTPFTLEPPGGANATLRVTPRGGTAGSTFTLAVQNARPFTDIDLRVTDPDTRETIFEVVVRTTVDGSAQVDFVSSATLPEKAYRVTASARNTEIATSTLTIGEAVFDPANVRVTVQPPDTTLGRVLSISATGLPPRQAVTVEVVAGGNVLREFTQTTSSTGNLTVTYRGNTSDPIGDYTLRFILNGELVATNTFVMGAGVASVATTDTPTPVTVTIEPTQGTRSTVHTITVGGLTANQAVDFDVTFAGQSVYATQKTADANGVAVLQLVAEEGDASGDYTVTISAGDVALGDVVMTVLEDSVVSAPVTLLVMPQSGVRGTMHVLTATGFTAGDTVTFEVFFNGGRVYTTEKEADMNGKAEVRLRSDDSDAAGDYRVVVSMNASTLAEGVFTVLESSAQATPPPATPAPTSTSSASSTSNVYEGVLSDNAPEARQRIEGRAGDVVSVSFESGDFDAYLQLLDENGNELAYSDDVADSLNSRIGAFVLPYTGTFEVVGTSYEYYYDAVPPSGRYTLTIIRHTPQGVRYDAPTTVALSAATSSQLFRFEASAGDVLRVTAAGDPDFDAIFALYDMAGNVLVEDDDGGIGYLPEIMRYIVTESGTYYLEARLYSGAFAGELTFTIERVALNTLDEVRTVGLGGKTTSETFTLNVQAGETVSIAVRVKEGAAAEFSLSAIQDGMTLMNYTAQGTPNELVVGFVAQQSGTVTLIITNSGSGAVFEVTR